ncbi:hypothetical protein AQI95_10470 [Streptomyces yokosukanensis]|uniref:DUF3592 domain-containing protein n=1 Tax=Streptomyces yokosukanensis TaxID=67386 RepID=A0A101P9M2_9ACTN|nr:DUF3592 domain-containing protein [Streptomyces yokosukanensis]KUN07446.1 hypothetical protein AQI95_10470 [Streptomyces yokosukanensis]
MTGETIGIGLAVLVGLAMLWAGAREARLQMRLSRRGVRAEGVVVDQEHEPGDDYSKPVVEFTDRQGRPVRFRPAAVAPGLALGTHVPVVYLPERRETARVFTRKYRMSPMVGLFFGGMLFLGVAVGCVLTR